MIAAAVMIPALVLAFAGYRNSDSVLAFLPAIGQLGTCRCSERSAGTRP